MTSDEAVIRPGMGEGLEWEKAGRAAERAAKKEKKVEMKEMVQSEEARKLVRNMLIFPPPQMCQSCGGVN